jgi:hypothetical protein
MGVIANSVLAQQRRLVKLSLRLGTDNVQELIAPDGEVDAPVAPGVGRAEPMDVPGGLFLKTLLEELWA